jgi:hypothetical protein
MLGGSLNCDQKNDEQKCCPSFVWQRLENQAIHGPTAKNTSLPPGLDSVCKVTKYQ